MLFYFGALECGPHENINNAESVRINRLGLTSFPLFEAKQAGVGVGGGGGEWQYGEGEEGEENLI
jgi:hypothetical protein